MQEFRSTHLQKSLGEVFDASEAEPVVILNRGQPRRVLMTATEFRRLKAAAGESIPREALPRETRTIQVRPLSDPLGYDTTDFWSCARQMAEDALSGEKADAIEAEADRVRAALRTSGLLPKGGAR